MPLKMSERGYARDVHAANPLEPAIDNYPFMSPFVLLPFFLCHHQMFIHPQSQHKLCYPVCDTQYVVPCCKI